MNVCKFDVFDMLTVYVQILHNCMPISYRNSLGIICIKIIFYNNKFNFYASTLYS